MYFEEGEQMSRDESNQRRHEFINNAIRGNATDFFWTYKKETFSSNTEADQKDVHSSNPYDNIYIGREGSGDGIDFTNTDGRPSQSLESEPDGRFNDERRRTDNVCEPFQPRTDTKSSVIVLILIILIRCPWAVAEQVLHPVKWMDTKIQSIWNSTMTTTLQQMTNTLLALRSVLTAPLKKSPVSCIKSLLTDNTDTSQTLLCRAELLEFLDVCRSWTTTLTSIPPTPGTSLPCTQTTSTFTTCVPSATTPAVAHSFFTPPATLSTERVDFGELIGESSSGQGSMPKFCDTYLKAIDSSTKLVSENGGLLNRYQSLSVCVKKIFYYLT